MCPHASLRPWWKGSFLWWARRLCLCIAVLLGPEQDDLGEGEKGELFLDQHPRVIEENGRVHVQLLATLLQVDAFPLHTHIFEYGADKSAAAIAADDCREKEMQRHAVAVPMHQLPSGMCTVVEKEAVVGGTSATGPCEKKLEAA